MATTEKFLRKPSLLGFHIMSEDWTFERPDDFERIRRINLNDAIGTSSGIWVQSPGGVFTPLVQSFDGDIIMKRRLQFAKLFGLNRGQTEVLVLTAEGMTHSAIAERLGVEPETIKDRLGAVSDRLGGRKLNVLCAAAGCWGIVSPRRFCVDAR